MLWKEALKKRNVNINMEKTKIIILVEEENVEMEVGASNWNKWRTLNIWEYKFKITENKKLK